MLEIIGQQALPAIRLGFTRRTKGDIVALDLSATMSHYGPMFEAPESIENALSMLGKLMVGSSIPHAGLLVCGGAALNVLGIASRSTRDVDVICAVEEGNGEIRFVERELAIPAEIIDTVARDLNLPREDRQGNPLPDAMKWLNNGPKRLLSDGLPHGMEQRLVRREYGPRLTVYFVDRHDQIHLKLYACLTSDRIAVHERDLMQMNVTVDEMRTAANWILSKMVTEKSRKKLREVLFELGHKEVIRDIERSL